MIQVAIRRVKSEEEERLRSWMDELGRRREEVLESFAQETVRHEQAFLLRTGEGPLLIYVIEAADHRRAASAFSGSTLPIDREHKLVMRQVLAGPVEAELLYDCYMSE